jgi:hypothetical protein
VISDLMPGAIRSQVNYRVTAGLGDTRGHAAVRLEFRLSESKRLVSRTERNGSAREIPRPAGEIAGLRDDTFGMTSSLTAIFAASMLDS